MVIPEAKKKAGLSGKRQMGTSRAGSPSRLISKLRSRDRLEQLFGGFGRTGDSGVALWPVAPAVSWKATDCARVTRNSTNEIAINRRVAGRFIEYFGTGFYSADPARLIIHRSSSGSGTGLVENAIL